MPMQQQQQRGGESMPISEDSLWPPLNQQQQQQPLIKHLCEYNNINHRDQQYYPARLAEAFRQNGRQIQDYICQLELRTKHLRPEGRNFPLKAAFITRKSARSLLAFKGGMGTSVEKFFYLRHRLRLQFPFLPCVAVKGGNEHVAFYPLEVLNVIIQPANEQEEEKMTMESTHADATTQTDIDGDDEQEEGSSNGYEEEEEEERQFEGTIILKIASIRF